LLGALLVYHLASVGLPEPKTTLAIVETTLWVSVAIFGVLSVIWLALLGMKRRGLLGLWLFLPLLLHYLLMSVAAWAAFYDLAVRPFHWSKTEHGLARARNKVAAPCESTEAPSLRAIIVSAPQPFEEDAGIKGSDPSQRRTLN
jgi:glycosyltransferase XagB